MTGFNVSELNPSELMIQMSELLIKYDYSPQGKLLINYSKYFNPADPQTVHEDAGYVLSMFGGWGGLVDIILSDEHGVNVEDNRRLDALRAELYKKMKKLAK